MSQVHNVQVVFRNHKEVLIELIARYRIVLGCVAWLTDYDVLDALAQKNVVQIIVQKEDFLRPDSGQLSDTKFHKKLREKYEALPSVYAWHEFGGVFSRLSPTSDMENHQVDAVRCMGNHNRDKKSAFPRMHHKFLIFTNGSNDLIPLGSPPGDPHTYYQEAIKVSISTDACVWTGSYNITHNATKSLENVVVLHCPKIAEAFYHEWSQIAVLSESLDWDDAWCAPQWMIDKNRYTLPEFENIPTGKVV